eukprot:gene23703-28722_t
MEDIRNLDESEESLEKELREEVGTTGGPPNAEVQA